MPTRFALCLGIMQSSTSKGKHKPPPKRAKISIFKSIVVPPPLDLKLGLPATQTINMQRQETTARRTQPGPQNTTSTQQRKITVSTSVANGLGTHVFQVELGHDVAAINTQTNKHITINKGTIVSIFQQETFFPPFFVLGHMRVQHTGYYKQKLMTV